jgi:hypothetical protein
VLRALRTGLPPVRRPTTPGGPDGSVSRAARLVARRHDVTGAPEPPSAATGWGRLPFFTLVAGEALVVVAAANALSRSGHGGGIALFWLASLSLVALATFRLTSPVAARRERVGILIVVGMTLYLVKVLKDPFTFTYSDEFLHGYNAFKVLDTGSLLSDNPILPVTPRYTGLPSETSVVASLTGFHVFGAGVVVIGAARLVMMLALFLLFEEITRSSRVAGLAGLIYAANPNFVFFTAQYAYESLALPLAVLVMAGVTRWMRRDDDAARHGWAVAVPIVSTAVVMTHHMTAYALFGFLAAFALVHALVSRGGGTRSPWPFAVFTGVAIVLWLTFVASDTVGYLTPIFTSALESALETITNETAPRELFVSESGVRGPAVERVVALSSIAIIALALPLGIRDVRRRYWRHPVALTFAAAAVGYLGTLFLRFIPAAAAWEVGNRASEFLFVGVALMLALAAAAGNIGRRASGRLLVAGAAVVVFAGGVITAAPPDVRLALPYRIIAEGHVLEPSGARAAAWTSSNLGRGARFGADQANARLLVAHGQVAFAGSSPNVDEVILYPIFTPSMYSVVAENRLRYIVMDRRRIRDDRTVGYFFASPRATRAGIYPRTWYEKFDRQPGVSRVFDSGDLVIYDVGRMRYDPDTP